MITNNSNMYMITRVLFQREKREITLREGDPKKKEQEEAQTEEGMQSGKETPKEKKNRRRSVQSEWGRTKTEVLGVLDKGLKYAPIKNLNKFDTYIGIQKYVRKIKIKKNILSNPQE